MSDAQQQQDVVDDRSTVITRDLVVEEEGSSSQKSPKSVDQLDGSSVSEKDNVKGQLQQPEQMSQRQSEPSELDETNGNQNSSVVEEQQKQEEEEKKMLTGMMETLLRVEDKYRQIADEYAKDRVEIEIDRQTLQIKTLHKELEELLPKQKAIIDESDVQKIAVEMKDVLLYESALKNSHLNSQVSVLKSKESGADSRSEDKSIGMTEQQELKRTIEMLREENTRITRELKQAQFLATQQSFHQKDEGESTSRKSHSSKKATSSKEVWSPQFELESNAFLYFSTKNSVISSGHASSPFHSHARLKPISAADLKPKSSHGNNIVSGGVGGSSSVIHQSFTPSLPKSVTRQVYKTAVENRQLFMEMISEEGNSAAAAGAAVSASAKVNKKKQSQHNDNNNNSPPRMSNSSSSSNISRKEYQFSTPNRGAPNEGLKNYRIKTNQAATSSVHETSNIFSLNLPNNYNSNYKNQLYNSPATFKISPNIHSVKKQQPPQHKTISSLFFDRPDLGSQSQQQQ